jgi:hypothetical protein
MRKREAIAFVKMVARADPHRAMHPLQEYIDIVQLARRLDVKEAPSAEFTEIIKRIEKSAPFSMKKSTNSRLRKAEKRALKRAGILARKEEEIEQL